VGDQTAWTQVTPTTWHCPGCDLTLEAVAVACGHECPERRGQWVDLIPTGSTDDDHDRVTTR
jgi:hypothetical protein